MDSSTYVEKADGYIESNDLVTALDVLLEAQELFPDDSLVVWKLANLYSTMHNLEAAEALFDSLFTRPLPVLEFAHLFNTALVKYDLKKYPEALDLLLKYIQAPDHDKKTRVEKAKELIAICRFQINKDNPDYVSMANKYYAEGKVHVFLFCLKKYESLMVDAVRQCAYNRISINKEEFFKVLKEKAVPDDDIAQIFDSITIDDESWFANRNYF
jgi:tetratricopeptide (TPR) repeat protein